MRFHPNAYGFIFTALKYAQALFGKSATSPAAEEHAHISGPQLLEGVRLYAVGHFGRLAKTVFNTWGIYTTEDFGRIVFELVERGDMRKTDRDQLSDFCDVYDFDQVFVTAYPIDVEDAFSKD